MKKNSNLYAVGMRILRAGITGIGEDESEEPSRDNSKLTPEQFAGLEGQPYTGEEIGHIPMKDRAKGKTLVTG
jgi:hypothetical protein